MESIKPLLMSLLTIGAVTIAGWTGTLAYFSDTETSSGNYFEAGYLNLTVGWTEYRNGEFEETVELGDNPGPIFELVDVKPGDFGNATIKLHVDGNDAYVWMIFSLKENEENNLTEQERALNDNEDDTSWDGELAQNITVVIWYDVDGDGIQDPDEKGVDYTIFEGTLKDLDNSTFLLNGSNKTTELEPFKDCTVYNIGFNWTISPDVGNIIQSDTCKFDIKFYAVQARHYTP